MKEQIELCEAATLSWHRVWHWTLTLARATSCLNDATVAGLVRELPQYLVEAAPASGNANDLDIEQFRHARRGSVTWHRVVSSLSSVYVAICHCV